MTVAGMLVVNTPGTWRHVYPPLLHAEWHGWTPTDTIFPFFLFIVGVSMAYSFARRLETQGDRRRLLVHLVRRSAVIFLLGLAMNVVGLFVFDRDYLRIPGVLQRIGLCILIAGSIHLLLGTRMLLPAAAVLLVLYWSLLTFVPVPGLGPGRLDPGGKSLAGWVDRAILGPHTWKPGWDPEGPLSTIPATATTLLGAAAGEWLRRRSISRPALVELMGGGAIALSLGAIWGVWHPINKNLWTSSYALFMSGMAAVALAICLWMVDIRGWKTCTAPFRWLGKNALAIFAASLLATLLLLAVRLPTADGKGRSLYGAIYRTLFDRFADPRLGSLLFALSFTALFVGLAGLLDRKRVYLKV